MRTTTKSEQTTNKLQFKSTLSDYKNDIDRDISLYSQAFSLGAIDQYGSYARLTTDTFLNILGRGGKRLRGSLVLVGYEMSGGKDKNMILQVARAIEMLHAYILIIDDIQDRSLMRRGGPSAHELLADYHRKHKLNGDCNHFGLSLALNSALGGAHAAQGILASLPVSEDLRLKVLSIVNRTMLVTAHGQTLDIMNESLSKINQAAIELVLEQKTAIYSFLNPLHVGMVLAGADLQATDAITTFAMRLGKAFQIVDDIKGVFGSLRQNGKNPLDDIKEGKRTVLTTYALKHARQPDKKFLIQNLGNQNLTKSDFERCRKILKASGALKFAQNRVEKETAAAVKALNKESWRWENAGVEFLRGFAGFIGKSAK